MKNSKLAKKLKKKQQKKSKKCTPSQAPSKKSERDTNSNTTKIDLESFSIDIESYKYDSEESETSDKLKKYLSQSDNLITVLQLLWKYVNSIGATAEITSITSGASLFSVINEIKNREKQFKSKQPIAKVKLKLKGKDKEDNKISREFTVKIYHIGHLKKIIAFNKHNRAALVILHETVIQQLVNSWENLLGDIFKWFITNKPDGIDSSKKISYADLLNFSSLEDAKNLVINEEIKNFLSKKDTKEQIKFFKDKLKFNFESQFPLLNNLYEIILRRHIIVHAGGLITAEYLSRVKPFNVVDTKNLKEGEYLDVPAKYVIELWDTIYSAGVIFAHLVGKKLFIGNEKEEEAIDDFLNNAAFLNLKSRQYKCAKTILEYAEKTRIPNTTQYWTLKLNIAQTYKWLGLEEECSKHLSSVDWKASNSVFQLCVAALTEDNKSFKEKLKSAINEGLITITELFEWPIFQKIRQGENFKQIVEDVVGYELPSTKDILEPKILDFKPSKTLSELWKIYKDES